MHSRGSASPAMLVLTALVALLTGAVSGAAAELSMTLDVLSNEIGVKFAPGGSEISFPGKVDHPDKLALCGIRDAQVNDMALLLALPDGDMKLVLPRLNQEHVLLSYANGGWYDFIAADLGFKLDAVAGVGQQALLLTGEITNPEALLRMGEAVTFDRGYATVERGDRIEVYGPAALVRPEQVPGFEGIKLPRGGWAFRLCNVRDQKLLGKGFAAAFGTPQDASATCANYGILLDIRTGGSTGGLRTVGHIDHGKSTLTGTVRDVAKFAPLGLEGATEGDRVHFIPQGGAWKLALCGVRTERLVIFGPSGSGKTTLLQPVR